MSIPVVLAPEYYVHQIYQNVPSASAAYITEPIKQLVYNVPCDTKLNISWSIEYVLGLDSRCACANRLLY